MTGYPKREKFYAHRLTRLIFKSCACQAIGHHAAMLIILVAHTEDAARYQGPVTFWNTQIMPVLGFRSPKQLNEARRRAIDAGWLVYDRENDRSCARYWTKIPKHVEQFNDEPIEPSILSENGKHSENGMGILSEFGTHSGMHCGTHSGKPPIPAPFPNPDLCPIPSDEPIPRKPRTMKPKATEEPHGFADWYSLYPRKAKRPTAAAAFSKAIGRIQRFHGLHENEAVEWLMTATRERLPKLFSDQEKYRPHPSSWLNAESYNDPVESAPSIPNDLPILTGRRRA